MAGPSSIRLTLRHPSCPLASSTTPRSNGTNTPLVARTDLLRTAASDLRLIGAAMTYRDGTRLHEVQA